MRRWKYRLKCKHLLAGAMLVWIASTTLQAAEQRAHAGKNKRPNIILIMADDLGAETLGCYGNSIFATPNLDRMASEGARYNNAYATPICTPTRAMILTGLHPNRTGFLERIDSPADRDTLTNRLPTHLTTFAQLFKDDGYATAIAGKWHLGQFQKYPDQPSSHGFDEYCLWTQYYDGTKRSRYYAPDNWEDGKHVVHGKETFGPDYYSDFLLDFIDRNQDRPFLVYYPMNLIHGPIVTPPSLKELARSKYPGDLGEKEQAIGHMITYMDMIAGKFLKKVKEIGQEENTLVIFTGDNGSAGTISRLGDLEVRGSKGKMIEAGTRVPLIARWPKQIPTGVRDELFSLMDILPTLATVADIPVRHSVDGMDLSHTLIGKSGKDRDCYQMAFEGGLYMVRNKQFRLHQDGRFYEIPVESNESRYSETLSKNPEHAEAKERLQAELDEYMNIQKTDDTYTVIPFSAKGNVSKRKNNPSAVMKKKQSSAARSKPNVVIFFADDQGTLDANCYGSDDLYTPTMDQLAATGVRFTQAYSHAVCCPARALLLTGRHPQRSGIINWTQQGSRDPDGNKPNLPLSEITLAEALKEAGYATALFGKWHLGSEYGHGPINQGFDTFFGHLGGFIDNYNHHFLHGKGFHDLYEGDEEIFMRDEYFPDLTTKRAVEYIEANKNTPFFMYVAFNIPHYPEQPDAKFDGLYMNMEMPRRSYAKMISTVDDRMGAIMKKLEKTGIRGNTIVLFLSDNGHSAENNSGIRVDNHTSGFPKGHYYSANGGGGNTGKWIGHKGQFYEGGVRVPAILSYPVRLPKGVVRDQAVIGADWFPTILKLCGVKLPKAKLDGRSLLPLIKSPDGPSPHKVLHWGWAGKWAVREWPWKLSGSGNKALHLGNLDDEAPEVKNYLEEKPELVKRLRDLHNQWAKDTAMGMD